MSGDGLSVEGVAICLTKALVAVSATKISALATVKSALLALSATGATIAIIVKVVARALNRMVRLVLRDLARRIADDCRQKVGQA